MSRVDELDPRWQWVEIQDFGKPGPDYVRGLCNHLPSEVVPVTSTDGETVAHLCQTCDTQLPAEWMTTAVIHLETL